MERNEEEVFINLSCGNDGAMLQEAYRKAAEDLTPQLVEAINAQWGQELTAGHPIVLT